MITANYYSENKDFVLCCGCNRVVNYEGEQCSCCLRFLGEVNNKSVTCTPLYYEIIMEALINLPSIGEYTGTLEFKNGETKVYIDRSYNSQFTAEITNDDSSEEIDFDPCEDDLKNVLIGMKVRMFYGDYRVSLP